MQKVAYFLVSLVVAATPAVASETWNVVEGPQGAVKGSWNVVTQGATLTGDAKMSGPQGDVTYKVLGQLQNGVYVFQRVASSDRTACAYRGAMKSDGVIAGSAMCVGASGPWIMRPAKK